MLKIYRESLRYFLASLPALLIIAAVIEGLLWLLEPKRESTLSFAALIFLAYYFHRHFLFGETLSFRNQKPEVGAPPFKVGWFFTISIVLILGTLGIGIAVAVSLLGRPQTGIVMLVYVATYLVTLSLFGTALPAAVARDNTYRLAQGLRATFSTMWRLILGPGIVGLLLLLAFGAANQALGQFDLPDDSLAVLAMNILTRTLGFLTTIFAVAVLCEMYRKTRPEPRDPQGSGVGDQTPA